MISAIYSLIQGWIEMIQEFIPQELVFLEKIFHEENPPGFVLQKTHPGSLEGVGIHSGGD